MKILIADDHRLILEAVAEKLAELAPQVSFVQALSVQELLDSVSADLDLAVIDLGMPGAHGVGHIAQVHQRQPGLRMVVLSGQEDPAIMHAALDAGASGFIPKAYSPDVMLSAIRLVLQGGVYVPPLMMSHPGLDDGHRTPGPDRQLEVLSLLSEGQQNKQIGRNLGISEGTVKIHLAAIFRALKVRNRTEAVVAARAVTAG